MMEGDKDMSKDEKVSWYNVALDSDKEHTVQELIDFLSVANKSVPVKFENLRAGKRLHLYGICLKDDGAWFNVDDPDDREEEEEE